MAEPFVALMRRYCIDYTNRHDLNVCDEIMSPDYVLHMGEYRLQGRDVAYKPAAMAQFAQFPHLGLLVHEIVTNGDRLAMRFSEHGTSLKHDGAPACWSGIGIYSWDGSVLTENWVEQDYFSRRIQLSSGVPAMLEAPAIDPWATSALRPDPTTERLFRSWLERGVPDPAVHHVDDGSGADQPIVKAGSVHVDDIFTAGRFAAFHVTYEGAYLGGLPGYDECHGIEVRHHVAGIGNIIDGEVRAHVVTDRLGLSRRLTRVVNEPGGKL